MEFKTINTQEEFDSAIKERLKRQAEKTAEETSKKFEGYISPEDYKVKTADFEKQIAALTSQLETSKAEFEKVSGEHKALTLTRAKERAALDAGLPIELAERLTGANAEDFAKDAQVLSQFMGSSYTTPLAENPKDSSGGLDAAYTELINGLLS